MKLILLLLPVLLFGFVRIAAGQQNVQFIYIGSYPDNHEDVLITSADFRGDYLRGKDSRLTKMYYTNQRTLDTLKSYILRNNWIKRSDTSKRENDKIDTGKLSDAYKIMGADAYPLYFKGKDCVKLFITIMRDLTNVGLGKTSVYNAMNHLFFQSDVEYLHRDMIDARQLNQNEVPYRIEDTPRIMAKPNN
jgi:hypothetical protein